MLLFAGVVILLIPVYQIYKGNTDRSRCAANLNAVFEALNQYAEQHDGRYPPIDRSETPGSLVPSLGSSGHPYTWASDIAEFMNRRYSFLCPAAKPDEIVYAEDPRSATATIPMSYGMYAPYGGYLMSLIENPDQTIIVGETSNRGSENTFDPLPFKSSSGQAMDDGFVMGWDNSNDDGDRKTSWITRLAFPDTAGGQFRADGPGRHPGHDHPVSNMLTVSGERLLTGQLIAKFHIGTAMSVSPNWTLPPYQQRAK